MAFSPEALDGWREGKTQKKKGSGSPPAAAAALALGADGVAMGTRFIATPECSSSDDIKHRILASNDGGRNTVATHIFDHLSPFNWGADLFGRALSKSLTLEKFQNFKSDRNFAPTVEEKKMVQQSRKQTQLRHTTSVVRNRRRNDKFHTSGRTSNNRDNGHCNLNHY